MRTAFRYYARTTGLRKLTVLLLFLAFGAVAEGIAFVLAYPVTEGLFTPGSPVPWTWLGALTAAAVVNAVLHHLSVPMGNEIGADLVQSIHRGIAGVLRARPATSLGPTEADRLRSLDGMAVVVLMGLPAHVLRPVVAAVIVPATVIVGVAFINLKLAAVLLAGSLALAAVSAGTVWVFVKARDVEGTEWLRRSYQGGPGRQTPSTLILPAADVVGWRMVEALTCAAVALCVSLAAAGEVGPAGAVALAVVSALMARPLLEAALLRTAVLNSQRVLETMGVLLDSAVPASIGGRPEHRHPVPR